MAAVVDSVKGELAPMDLHFGAASGYAEAAHRLLALLTINGVETVPEAGRRAVALLAMAIAEAQGALAEYDKAKSRVNEVDPLCVCGHVKSCHRHELALGSCWAHDKEFSTCGCSSFVQEGS